MVEKITDDKCINIDVAAEYFDIKTVTLQGLIRNRKDVLAYKIGE